MNKVLGPRTNGKQGKRSAAAHPFVEQSRIAARAAVNQAKTFWTAPTPTKKSAPPIGAIEGPKGSFS